LRQEIDLSPLNPPPPPIGSAALEETLSFWEQICDVAEDQWATEDEKGFKVYLYEGPGGNGAPYIKRLTHPFDIEWVKENFGGGFYRATLNNPGGKIVASVRFAIEGESKRKSVQSVQNAPAAAQTTDGFQSQVLQILREGQERQERLLAQVLERDRNPAPAPNAIDPNIALQGVVQIFSGLVARAAPPQMDLVQMFALVDRFKGPDLLEQIKAMKEAGLIPSSSGGSGGSLVAQIRELKEAAEAVGIGSDKGKSLGEALIENGPKILEAGANIIERYKSVEETRLQTARTVQQIQQRGAAVVTPPPQPAAGQIPNQTAPQYTVQPPPGQAAGTGLEVEAPSAAATIAQAEANDAFIKGKIVEMISNGDSGGDIIDFLDKIDREICNAFTGASVEQVILFFTNDPALKKAATLPRFKAVITEIVEELNAPDEQLETPTRLN